MVTAKVCDHVFFGDADAAAEPERMWEDALVHHPVHGHLGHAHHFRDFADRDEVDLVEVHGYRGYTV